MESAFLYFGHHFRAHNFCSSTLLYTSVSWLLPVCVNRLFLFCSVLFCSLLFACSCRTGRSIVSYPSSPSSVARMAASDTARLDVVSSRSTPCHCCRDFSPLPQSSNRLLLPSSGFRGVSPGKDLATRHRRRAQDGITALSLEERAVPPHCPQTWGDV